MIRWLRQPLPPGVRGLLARRGELTVVVIDDALDDETTLRTTAHLIGRMDDGTRDGEKD